MKAQEIMQLSLLLIAQLTLAKTGHGIANNTVKQNPGICFTENKGQVHDQNYQPRPDVLYGTMTGNMAVHIRKTGVSYQLYRVDDYIEIEDLKNRKKHKVIAQQTIYRVDLNWVNANNNFVRIEDEVHSGCNNYYLENCPNGAIGVNSYKGITLKNIFNGIDLHYYEKNGELKHDYLVAAHADYEQIRIIVYGAEITTNVSRPCAGRVPNLLLLKIDNLSGC